MIKLFSQITKKDVAAAGGKGASLGEMTHAGIPVPPGFVVLAQAFDQFIRETGLDKKVAKELAKLNPKNVATLADGASERIKKMILAEKMPAGLQKEILATFAKMKAPLVAVRSSATSEDGAEAAWAGQLDTFLNTTKKTLLQNVQRCWASLFTPRAIVYRLEKKLGKKVISVAVVVQGMIQSDVAGVAFSVHPVTQDRNQMIIEAGWGLGEALVSGQITPDSYVVDKKKKMLLEVNVSEQSRGIFRSPKGGVVWKNVPKQKASTQKLSGRQIVALAELIMRLEKHYGFPVDVEWGVVGGKMYILQSRPITTLG